MIKFLKAVFGVVVTAGCICFILTFALVLREKARRDSKIRSYIMVLQDGTKVEWKGTHITNNGFCTTIWLNGRVDTVVCMPHVMTEATDPEAAQPAPEEPKPSSIWDKERTARS